MTKEEERKPNRFTLEAVVRVAKEVTLKDGGLVPTLIVEGSLKYVVSPIKTLSQTRERQVEQMYSIGSALGQTKNMGELQQIFFAREGWLSGAASGKLLKPQPSPSPHRREVLTITYFVLQERRTQILCFEMMRNYAGRLIALRELSSLGEVENRFESRLLEAFVEGFRTARRTRLN